MSVISATQRAPRWRRRPTHRPDEIVSAALHVFAQRGLHQTTLDDIAKAAGVSKGTIYLYFKSKEDLFVAAAQQVVPAPEELSIKTLPIPFTSADLGKMLRAIARVLYRRFRSPAYLAVFGLIAAETLRHPEWGQVYFERIVLALNRRVADLLQQATSARAARKVDTLLAARAFLGMFLTMAVTQEHLGGKQRTPFSEKHIIDSLIDIFLHGIQCTKEKDA